MPKRRQHVSHVNERPDRWRRQQSIATVSGYVQRVHHFLPSTQIFTSLIIVVFFGRARFGHSHGKFQGGNSRSFPRGAAGCQVGIGETPSGPAGSHGIVSLRSRAGHRGMPSDPAVGSCAYLPRLVESRGIPCDVLRNPTKAHNNKHQTIRYGDSATAVRGNKYCLRGTYTL